MARLIPALPLFHVVAGQPAIVLGEGEAAEAKRRLVLRAGAVPVADIDTDARIAFVALAEPEAAAAALRARGVLVNVPDRPDLCDFTVPALVDRAPVVIAIGTGGASAGLAKALRLRLDAMLPPSLGGLASALGHARQALRARFPDAAARRRALDAALERGGALDPLDPLSAGRVSGWLEGAQAPAIGVHEIRLESDDPDDLTLRAARLLGAADVVVHEAGVAAAIIDRARADAARHAIAPAEPAPDFPGVVVVLRRA